VRFDRMARDREPEPRAGRLQGEEGLEEPGQRLGGNAGAIVRDRQGGDPLPVADGDRDPPRRGGHRQRIARVLEQVQEHLAELVPVGAGEHAGRPHQIGGDPGSVEPRTERVQRCPRQLPQVDRLEAELVAAREAEQPAHLPLDALELLQDEPVLGGARQPRLARELLRQAARGGHGVADLVRDARCQLAERGELLGVRQRTLDRDRAREEVRAVEQEGELGYEGLELLDVVLAEEAAQHAGVHEEMAPAAARAQDRRGAQRDVGSDERLAQCERKRAQLDASEAPRGERVGRGAARPDAHQRRQVEVAVGDCVAVGQDDGRAGHLPHPHQLGERAPAALERPQLG
jgi:hypothetical protein